MQNHSSGWGRLEFSELPRALGGRVRSPPHLAPVSDRRPDLAFARDTHVCARKHPLTQERRGRNEAGGEGPQALFFLPRPGVRAVVAPYPRLNNQRVNSRPLPTLSGQWLLPPLISPPDKGDNRSRT